MNVVTGWFWGTRTWRSAYTTAATYWTGLVIRGVYLEQPAARVTYPAMAILLFFFP